MKSIVFRASFQGPTGPLNPSGWKVPGPIRVEVFQDKNSPPEWRARNPDTGALFESMTPQSTAETFKSQIAGLYFEERLTGWDAFDSSVTPFEQLRYDEWTTDPQGRVHFTRQYEERRLERKKGALPPKADRQTL